MENLNQLQIFKNTVKHVNSGKFLFYANFTPDIENRIRARFNILNDTDLLDYFGMYNPVDIEMKPPEGYKKSDFSGYYKDMTIPEGAFINHLGVLEIPGSMFHFSQYISPLRNASDFAEIEQFPYRDFSSYSDEGMKEKVELAHENGRVASCAVGNMYEYAWKVRGYEQFLEDMLMEPEWCEYILDKIKNKNLIIARAAARAGVDVIVTGDDVANQRTLMFKPDDWRKFMKVRWAQVFKAARMIKPDIQIKYHSDGNIEAIIPDLIEIGVTILNPIQPECVDPVKIKELYGDKIVLDGTIGTQTVIPFGTPEDVKGAVRERVQQLGRDGALILSPTHALEPEVPIENIIAFIDAIKEING
jgi:uroporphyrinogen decarboxylase